MKSSRSRIVENRKKLSDKTKNLMRLAKLGKPSCMSIEKRELLRKKMFGNKFNLGGHHTKEEKERRRIRMLGNKIGVGFKNNWKGGLTPLILIIRHSYKYRQWRSDVFTRDDYVCQDCGIRSGCGHGVLLEAHHLKRFSDIIHKNKITSLEQSFDCEELWNINNGLTLCIKCHNKTKRKK